MLDEVRQLVRTHSLAGGVAVDVVSVPGMRLRGTHDSVHAQAQQISGQLGQAKAPDGSEAGLQAEAHIERLSAEACRTVLPEHRWILRQLVELFEP